MHQVSRALMQVGTKMRRVGSADGYTAGGLAHWCPACEEMHAFALDGKNSSGAQWTWDGNVQAPTFAPSMNIRVNPRGHKHYQPDVASSTCHYFLRRGQIQFLPDCSHRLKGRTVPLPDLPERYRDRPQKPDERGSMTTLIIDVAEDITRELPRIAAAGKKTVFGYMSSINPGGAKCWTVARVKAAAAAGLRIGLVHEGWGGSGGKGISVADGLRDGAYCRKRAAELGAPAGACVYFACDRDFSRADIDNLVLPYFRALRGKFIDGLYRIGVYGSGAVCAAVVRAKLADLSWEAQSRGWTGYSAWRAKASMAQGPEGKVAGVDADTDQAQGDIGDYVPMFADAPSIAPIAAAHALSVAPRSAPRVMPRPPHVVQHHVAHDDWLADFLHLIGAR